MTLDFTNLGSSLPPRVGPFLARLVSLGLPQPFPSSPSMPTAPAPETTLTPSALRATLLRIGITASDTNFLLAEAFAQLGLPLSPSSITEAHIALAQASDASPMAYALAKSLGLPTTPDILRALATVTDGIPARRTLPMEVMEWLALAVPAGENPEAIATHLRRLIDQCEKSTERRLLDTDGRHTPPDPDTHTLLLRLADSAEERSVRTGADALAAHLEGQQLINLAAQRDQTHDHPIPLYFALPLLLAGEQTMLEMNIRQSEPTPEEDGDEEEAGWQTTIRLATSRLGRIEIELIGGTQGDLTCRLGAENAPTVRLLKQGQEKLATALAASGWPRCDVSCRVKAEWPVLWHGGQALTAPRLRVDWEA